MEDEPGEMSPVDLPVGDTLEMYKDEDIRLKVIRISQSSILTIYERPESGQNLLVLEHDLETGDTTFNLDEIEPDFWTIFVDGNQRDSLEIGEIIENEKIIGTEVEREERRIVFTTE